MRSRGSASPRIGLVLGGGGIAGYAFHCAALAGLVETSGFDPRTAEILVGTSAGAISSAIIRGDVPAQEIRDRLLAGAEDPDPDDPLALLSGIPQAVPRLWAGPGAPNMAVRELRRGRNIRLSKLVAALLPQGRQDLSPVIQPLTDLHRGKWPKRELWIPATDLRTGRLRVFGRDEEPTVSEAVAASAALPVFFAPVTVNGREYIDGGISSPFNTDLLVGRPLDLVIVLAPLSIEELRTGAPIASVARSLPRRRLRGEVDRIADSGTATLVLQPDQSVSRAMGLNPMDHQRVPEILARSQELVQRRLTTASPSVLEVLDRAARTLRSPADVAYPDPTPTAG